MGQQNANTARAGELVSGIRFGFYGARKLARLGHRDLAAKFRRVARGQVRELRSLRVSCCGGGK